MTAASTTWGLFLLVLLLGYGLVQMPVNIYNHSRTNFFLSHTQFKLSQLYNEKVEVEDRLDTSIDELTKLCMQIKADDPLRPYLEQVIRIVPEQYSDRIKLTVEDYENHRIVLTTRFTDLETEEKLIKLHERLKSNIHIHHRVQTYWLQRIAEAFYLEDILNSENNSEHRFIRENPFPSSWLRQKLFNQHPILGKDFHQQRERDIGILEWYTFCRIRRWALRILGISLGLISIMVIWSEMTFFSTKKVILSIFALCVNSARDHHAYLTMEVSFFSSKNSKANSLSLLDILLVQYRIFMYLCILHYLSYSSIQLFLFITLSSNR